MKRWIHCSTQINASEGIYKDEEDTFTIAGQIAVNIKGEFDAIEGYDKLIPFLEGDQESIDQIKEIISDELNHAEVLRAMMKKYDQGIETAKD